MNYKLPLPSFLLLALFSLFCGPVSHAQDAAVCNIKHTDGLAGENVNNIFKDSRGIVWIGTNRGLTCYNGKSVVNFLMEETEQKTAVNDIAEMPDGTIVMATSRGLFQASFPTLSCKRMGRQIKDASSLCLLGGHLFVGSSAGIYEYVDEQHTDCYLPGSNIMTKDNAVRDICAADKTHLWICTDRQVARFDIHTHQLQPVSLQGLPASGSITTLAYIRPWLFIGTSGGGLLRHDTASGETTPYSLVPASYIRDLNVGTDGILYVSGNEPYKIDTRHDRLLATYGRQHNATSRIALPSDGSYTYWHDERLDISWFGFFQEGLSHNYHVRPLVHVYRYKDFDSSQLQVRSFCIHGDDILIGTRMGLYHINEKKDIVRYWAPEELGASVVTDIVWFAGRFALTTYERGVRIYNAETMSMSTPQGNSGLAEGNFSCMAVTPDGQQLYAAGNLGLFVLNDRCEYLRNINYRNSNLPDSYITTLFFDRQGMAWIGTMQNLCLYDPEAEVVMASGFPEGFFGGEPQLAFQQAPDGDIIAYGGGKIHRTSPNLSQYETYDLDQRLDAGDINFTYPVRQGYLVGTQIGICLFDSTFSHFMQYTEADNLPSLNFNKQEIQQTPDGTLWIGNCKGLIYITPKGLSQLADSIPGRVMLTLLKIDDRDQDFGRLLSLTEKPDIRLSWNFGCDKLTFVPLLLDYAKHTNRYYEYSIDGAAFQTAPEDKKTDVARLFLGNHILTVRLAGHPETATTYHIRVRPAGLFYFEVLFLITLIIAIWALIHLRRRSILHRKKLRMKHKLEREISAQTAVRQLLMRQEEERHAYEQEQEEMRQQRTAGKEYKEIGRRVKEYMELERPYRNVKFRLSDLAKAVDSSPTQVSLMLNQNLNTNFYDFVNRYRLEEFKRRSQDERYRHLGMMALAEMCGFKKTTFFAAFKKFEGCTPGEWAAQS